MNQAASFALAAGFPVRRKALMILFSLFLMYLWLLIYKNRGHPEYLGSGTERRYLNQYKNIIYNNQDFMHKIWCTKKLALKEVKDKTLCKHIYDRKKVVTASNKINKCVCVCVSVLFTEEHGIGSMTAPMNVSFRSSAHSLRLYT